MDKSKEVAKDEIITLCNERHEPVHTGVKRKEYESLLRPGVYADVVNIVVRAIHEGETYYLITKRSANKKLLPDFWEFTSGGVMENEDTLTAAIRELREETGICADPENVIRLGIMVTDIANMYKTLYMYTIPQEQTEEQLPTLPAIPNNEVCDYRWVREDNLPELFIDTKDFKFLKYMAYILSFLHECKSATSNNNDTTIQ